MKKLLVLASVLFLAAVSLPTSKADVMNPGPGCGSDGCGKPPVSLQVR